MRRIGYCAGPKTALRTKGGNSSVLQKRGAMLILFIGSGIEVVEGYACVACMLAIAAREHAIKRANIFTMGAAEFDTAAPPLANLNSDHRFWRLILSTGGDQEWLE